MKLRKDPNVILVAAQNGATIHDLYVFCELTPAVIWESINYTVNNRELSDINRELHEVCNSIQIDRDLLRELVKICPPSTLSIELRHGDMYKTKMIIEELRTDESLLQDCIKYDAKFFDYAGEHLKHDEKFCEKVMVVNLETYHLLPPDMQTKLERYYQILKNRDKAQSFYGIDGTKFDTYEEAIAYNQKFELEESSKSR